MSNIIDDLTNSFSRLPGIGKKSAARIVNNLLKANPGYVQNFARQLSELQQKIKPCSVCGAWTEINPCPICSNPLRDKSLICVVEQPQDVITIDSTGTFSGLDASGVDQVFGNLTSNPGKQIFWMALVTIFSFVVVGIGLKNGVEKITKVMMSLLLVLIVVLAINSITLKGSSEGLKFYLLPDFSKVTESGFGEVIFAAMGQAFFTLSLGIGSMEIFGSYIDKKYSLTGESLRIIILDTFVAIASGLIIFPACYAYGVNPGAGPQLLFITMPNIFNNMAGSRLWGTLFFIFMSFAAISTLIAVF